MALVNVMEQIVSDKLDQILEGEDCCKCNRCVEDMKAIALNRLPSKYVNTNSGELFSKLNATVRQSSVDINIAVTAAVKLVAQHPSHAAGESTDSE